MDNLNNFPRIKDKKAVNNVPPLILRSWQRCRELDIQQNKISKDHVLTQSSLKVRLDENENLLRAAKPILHYIYGFLRNKNYLLVISDKDGYVIETLGDPSFLAKTDKIFISPGVNWREDLKGTNGIGTTLIEQVPVNIPGKTHYLSPVSFLECWAAPIRSFNGELVGVLNISGEAGKTHNSLMESTIIGARMIEQSVQILELKQNFHLCQKVLKAIGKGSEVGEDGLIVSQLSSILKFREEAIAGKQYDIFFNKKQNYLTKGFNPENENTFWIGRSEKTKAVFEMAQKISKTDVTVLIQGESGTGKEIIARYIHYSSNRKDKPFVTINCAAIPDNLVESELFGYVDGAFTGAKKGGQPGKFELAHGGTIFLDEVGDMPLNVQTSLLRVLQQKEFYRIGDCKTQKVDVRVIAATNQDMQKLVENGKFRLDLYYRLKVILIRIPPLRERSEDILELVPYFLDKYCKEFGYPPLEISPEVFPYLINNPWPGNIRQLENCIQSMVALSNQKNLTVDDLPSEYLDFSSINQEHRENNPMVLALQTEDIERKTIIHALTETHGNIAAAARVLGIGRTTLYRKMDKLLIR